MNNKNIAQVSADIKKMQYYHLKQQQYALNMQIKLAMQSYDSDMQTQLEKEREEVGRRMKEISG